MDQDWRLEKYFELNVLPIYDDRSIKINIWTYGDEIYTNFCGLNVPEDSAECKSFIIISINSSLNYENKYYFETDED